MPRRGRQRPNKLKEAGIEFIDYKDEKLLRRFLSDRGKIVPRRMSGLTERQQRALTVAIKRARQLALLPYVSESFK
jgi:small subunit ribosomal protein S18